MKTTREKENLRESIIKMYFNEDRVTEVQIKQILKCSNDVIRNTINAEKARRGVINRKSIFIGIHLGSKQEAYHRDEMSYGTAIPQFKWEDLDKREQQL